MNRDPCWVAWNKATALNRRSRGKVLGRRAWAEGIWVARAEPLRRDNNTRCHISMAPVTTRTASSRLWARFIP